MTVINFTLYSIAVVFIVFCIVMFTLISIKFAEWLEYDIPKWLRKLMK